MKSNVLMATLLSGMVLAAGAAQAAGHGDRPDFAQLDLDGDGALTLQELQARGQARFEASDSNGDGALSADEMIAAANARTAERVARMIARFDANGDGVLQPDEMPGRGGDFAGRMFERVDADGDGQLTEEEFEAAKKRWGDRRGQGPRDRG